VSQELFLLKHCFNDLWYYGKMSQWVGSGKSKTKCHVLLELLQWLRLTEKKKKNLENICIKVEKIVRLTSRKEIIDHWKIKPQFNAVRSIKYKVYGLLALF